MNRRAHAGGAAAHDWCNDSAGPGYFFGSAGDIDGNITVSTASRDVAEHLDSEFWVSQQVDLQGLLPAHFLDSGSQERSSSFFIAKQNDDGNNNNPRLVAALPSSTAMNVNINGKMDSPVLTITQLSPPLVATAAAVQTFQSHQPCHASHHPQHPAKDRRLSQLELEFASSLAQFVANYTQQPAQLDRLHRAGDFDHDGLIVLYEERLDLKRRFQQDL